MKSYIYIVMFEFAMLNHPIINVLSQFFLHISSPLYILSSIYKLCFEEVYSIALSFNLLCLITIFIFISAIAVFTIKKGYDYLKDALLKKRYRKEILEQELDPKDNPDRRIVDIGWATLLNRQGILERVIFQNNDYTSSWLVEAYKSKPIRFNLNGVIRTGILVKIGQDEQADKEIGIYISPYINTPYLGIGEGGIWTTRPPIREYFENSAPRDMVHPKARLLSEGRPIIFDRDFKKMFVRGLERDAYKLDK